MSAGIGMIFNIAKPIDDLQKAGKYWLNKLNRQAFFKNKPWQMTSYPTKYYETEDYLTGKKEKQILEPEMICLSRNATHLEIDFVMI